MARDGIGCGVAEEEWTDVSVGEGLEDIKLETCHSIFRYCIGLPDERDEVGKVR